MAKAMPRPWTIEEFLDFEEQEDERYEYVDGIVRMMTGASAAHSAIKGNVFAALRSALQGSPCRVDVNDLKVVAESAVMYPDVMVTCRPIGPDEDRVDDPTVVFEVLSPTTERHDRIGKWPQYQGIGSLRHFVIIEQKVRRIEVYTRATGGWTFTVVEPPRDEVVLDAIGVRLSLDAVYEGSGR